MHVASAPAGKEGRGGRSERQWQREAPCSPVLGPDGFWMCCRSLMARLQAPSFTAPA